MARKAAAQLRILSYSSAPFVDREEAGKLLAVELSEYRGQKAVVLGIPRGGVVVAREVARVLDADLDVVLARKLRTPGHEELAMGSVAEDGKLFLNQGVVSELGVGEAYIQQEKARQLVEIKRRTELIRQIQPKIPLKGRIVIVTDDGIATGATTQAALWAVRLEQPEKLIAAIPVGPEDTIRRLAKDVDEMLCLRAPPLFAAVGQFYQQFYPVEDEDVLRILGEQRRSR
ncbi:MAG: phosphoribosyltransferase [Chloroflexi bacterium]|nr:phosphoribosyltransferase [Chloroflexota bacterium]MBI3931691.1 phosphoribosyltransferase [Chloroflexota bacterium]